MRVIITLLLSLAAGPALAHIGHIGHIGEAAGHSHWAAAGAIAIALGIAAIGARRGKRKSEEDTAASIEHATEDDNQDHEEATA